jgi:hypothetical protein
MNDIYRFPAIIVKIMTTIRLFVYLYSDYLKYSELCDLQSTESAGEMTINGGLVWIWKEGEVVVCLNVLY